MNTKQPRLIPLADWPQYHAWPPLGGLRHLVFLANENGFNKVIRRAGRRILIDEQAFFDWIETESEAQGLPPREVGDE